MTMNLPDGSRSKRERLFWFNSARPILIFGGILLVGCSEVQRSPNARYPFQIKNPQVVLWDLWVAYPGEPPAPEMPISLVSTNGSPRFSDAQGHVMEFKDLIADMRRLGKEVGDRGKIVYSLHVPFAEATLVAHLDEAIYQFRNASRKSGLSDRMTVVIMMPGLETGKFGLRP